MISIGTYADIPAQEHVFAYQHYDRCEGLAVLLNLSHEVQTMRLPGPPSQGKILPFVQVKGQPGKPSIVQTAKRLLSH